MINRITITTEPRPRAEPWFEPNFNFMFVVLLASTVLAMGLIVATLPDDTPLTLPAASSPVVEDCQPRADWLPYTLRDGESLETVAWQLGVSVDMLTQANCLSTTDALASPLLYVPAFPQS